MNTSYQNHFSHILSMPIAQKKQEFWSLHYKNKVAHTFYLAPFIMLL